MKKIWNFFKLIGREFNALAEMNARAEIEYMKQERKYKYKHPTGCGPL